MKASEADENYLVIGAHVDPATEQKIINHQYVDFAKLVPKSRFCKTDDNRLELVSKGGLMYFVPVSDREDTNISNFGKWEQAFRVYCNIYMRSFPEKASQLIQYNHVIHHAFTFFTWENVYMYDKEFRMHMSHYPNRNWAIILQQVWSMYLKDRLPYRSDTTPSSYTSGGHHGNAKNNGEKINEPCRRFNKGKCPNGPSCKYEHHCTVPKCGKFGHGAHICRKRLGAAKNSNGNTASNPNST